MINIMDRGASPNASAEDNTSAIQAVLDSLPSNEQVLIPSGNIFKIAGKGIAPKSNTLIQLNGALQQVTQPNEDYHHLIFLATGVDNISIKGNGMLRGDRDVHIGNEGNAASAGGYCLEMGGASNISVYGITLANSWADGILLGNSARTKNVSIDGVRCVGNRRNGLSAIDVDGLHIQRSQFRNNGFGPRWTAPQLGIDFECEDESEAVLNAVVETSVFDNNGDDNISIGSPVGKYGNIFIASSNVYDHRHQPISVSGRAGKLGAPWWANIAKQAFEHTDFYRYWGFPNEWRSS